MVGQQEARRAFEDALRTGRLHHAWLLTGTEGIGKATMAFWMARLLLKGTDPDSPAARRIAAGSHADLLTIARGVDEKRQRLRAEIVADDVRPIGQFLHRTAAEDGWRVVIVDGAEYMNRSAANAILKLLEEPPPRAILILTCATPGRLLPTIRSRCRTLKLGPLSPADMHAVLSTVVEDAAPDDIARVVPLAHGSPGRALALLAGDGGALGALVARVMDAPAGPGAMREGEMYEIAEAVLKRENGFSVFFDLLCDAISVRTRAAVRGTIPAERPADRMVDLWRRLVHLRAETEQFNLDKHQAILSGLTLVSGI
ncbi:putative DNA polymerase III delta' subunit [Gluconacetobacter diazotrophicus PA1 5]|uniref:Putative DNA polymerase III delta' subunit n=1 Tax=Gluconacetobacter diazotrophicus (strain ATCC 49037 / DSM 5601 / CCUG 37298 / CIP 103539 / LMG 7603 / PAl5) TaxID=272568 RepID=A9HIA0_GLUDA|nr:putative DNA polymerase III delta' subunit [Gluconacetobacter diazotrophicus PA1 5]